MAQRTRHKQPPQPPGRTVAVVLSAGQGTRMGAARNKVFLHLGGRPILVHALEAFERSPAIGEVLLVASADEVEYCQREIVAAYGLRKVRRVCAGGATRHQSEACALTVLREEIAVGAIALVLVHDGARPFVAAESIAALLAATRASGAALLTTPVAPDEVLLACGPAGEVLRRLAPQGLARAQTPQAFAAPLLLAAYDRAAAEGFEGTDTAASIERLGLPVAAVPCDARNLKITTPEDLRRAEALLAL